MNRLMTAGFLSLLAVAVCKPVQGLEATFDISGYEIFGVFDDEFPSFSTSFGIPGTVTEVSIDAVGESFGESLNSEVIFSIDTDFQFVDISGLDLDLPDAPGPFTILTTEPVPVSVGSIDGEVFLTLHEEFVDGESPDSSFGPNSIVTITFDPYTPVPAPEATDLGLISPADTPFSIDTFGSNFDTELGLYDADGFFIDSNDDALQGNTVESELVFPSGLPSGKYYLALGGNVTEFGPLGFDAVPLAGSDGGDFSLNDPTGTTSGVLAQETVDFFSFSVGIPGADFDGDGDVDGDDFLTWQGSFDKNNGGDADGNGVTDGADLVIFESQFGSGAIAGVTIATVPEPATISFGVLMAAALLAIRRRHC